MIAAVESDHAPCGFIADQDDVIDWIAPPPDECEIPPDYADLIAAVDALVMGRVTYEISLRLPGGTDVFAGKNVYVIASSSGHDPHEGVEFVHSDPVAFVQELKRKPGGIFGSSGVDVWHHRSVRPR